MKKIEYPTKRTSVGKFIEVEINNNNVNYSISNTVFFSHDKSDIITFKHFVCRVYLLGLSKQVEIYQTFNLEPITIKRWIKEYYENSHKIFNEKKNHGHSYKLISKVLERIQAQIDNGLPYVHIAKKENISESSIRYAIKNGKLKKRRSNISTSTNTSYKFNINDNLNENSNTICEKDCNKKIYLT